MDSRPLGADQRVARLDVGDAAFEVVPRTMSPMRTSARTTARNRSRSWASFCRNQGRPAQRAAQHRQGREIDAHRRQREQQQADEQQQRAPSSRILRSDRSVTSCSAASARWSPRATAPASSPARTKQSLQRVAKTDVRFAEGQLDAVRLLQERRPPAHHPGTAPSHTSHG